MPPSTTPLTTPSRRSTRYKVQAADIFNADPDAFSYAWSGPASHTRETSFEDDLHQPEIEAINAARLDNEENSKLDSLIMDTTFYKALLRGRETLISPSRTKRRKLDQDSETYSIGDTVFVKSQTGVPNVAVIIALWDTRILKGEFPGGLRNRMKVQVHWFMRPHQCAMVRKRRKFYQNELYFTTDQVAVLDPSSIIEHCVVSDVPADTSKLVEMQPEQSSKPKAAIKAFVCRSALHSGHGHYYELDWEDHRKSALSTKATDGVTEAWRVTDEPIRIKPRGKARAKPTYQSDDDESSDGEASDYENEEEDKSSDGEGDDINEADASDSDLGSQKSSNRAKSKFRTPRKKRKLATLTPSSKVALGMKKKRKLAKRDLSAMFSSARSATDTIRLENLPSDPFLRAMRLLHVGSRPDALPCREDEYMEVMGAVLSLLEEGSGGCIYISGVPGTGKTATVHNVVRDLKSMAERNEVNPFTYVEINGLRVSEPSNAYPLLWEAVSHHDVDAEGRLEIRSKDALRKLHQYFTAGVQAGPGSHACIVLMDELDQLVTPKQDIIYNFFNWPNLNNSKLIVVAVANTHDLPERVMSGKVRSRLGMLRINFHPYTRDQLHKIVEARLATAKEGVKATKAMDIFEQDAIKFAAMKVSGVSGDARRVLDVCRRAVELIRSSNENIVKIAHVKQVIDAMQNSYTAVFLRDCSLHERILLAALLKCIKRTGVDEIPWSDVVHQHLLYMNTLTDSRDPPKRRPTVVDLSYVLDSLVASRAIIVEMAVNLKKSPMSRKVMLNLEVSEVERVLSEVGGSNWRNALGM